MRQRTLVRLTTVVLVCFAGLVANAAAPQLIKYQGVVKDDQGDPVVVVFRWDHCPPNRRCSVSVWAPRPVTFSMMAAEPP